MSISIRLQYMHGDMPLGQVLHLRDTSRQLCELIYLIRSF